MLVWYNNISYFAGEIVNDELFFVYPKIFGGCLQKVVLASNDLAIEGVDDGI